MKFRTLTFCYLLSVGSLPLVMASCLSPAQAENADHTRQLLATKQCQQCELSNAGLVFADLSNADLSRSNLTGVNLSRANLQGADLRGANLTGASLAGANLTGAKLDGSNLTQADLRGSYLAGTTWEGALTDNLLLQGAIGLPLAIGRPEDFYRWAVEDAQQKSFAKATENFTHAIERRSNYAQAYLGRATARLQSGDQPGAIQDSQRAETLFKAQGNLQAAELSQQFTKELTVPAPPEKKTGKNLGHSIISGIATLLQLMIP